MLAVHATPDIHHRYTAPLDRAGSLLLFPQLSLLATTCFALQTIWLRKHCLRHMVKMLPDWANYVQLQNILTSQQSADWPLPEARYGLLYTGCC